MVKKWYYGNKKLGLASDCIKLSQVALFTATNLYIFTASTNHQFLPLTFSFFLQHLTFNKYQFILVYSDLISYAFLLYFYFYYTIFNIAICAHLQHLHHIVFILICNFVKTILLNKLPMRQLLSAGAFMGSAALNPVGHEEFGRCKQVRKSIQKEVEYQVSLLEKRQKLKSKMEQKSKKIGDLLHSKKNYKQSMSQLINILNIFNLAQNHYLQLREEQDGADTCFEDIGNWVLEFKLKIYK